jgi:ribosome-binding protein aMBF1 (putative translation factor)
MIKNERQYRVTKGQLAKLESALKLGQQAESRMDPVIYKAMAAGIESQADDLRKELDEYERTKGAAALRLHSPKELPQLLIKARVARGYSQKDLAQRLRLKPQQIQKYEATEYRSASLARILSVMEALDLHLDTEIHLGSSPPS